MIKWRMWILWAKNSLLNSGELSVEEPPWSLKNMPLEKIVETITVLMYPINKDTSYYEH